VSATVTEAAPRASLATLQAIERRVLWLAVRIIDYANRDRPGDDELKVGGHQASSASLASLMTVLYFAHLRAADRVSVKPHAAPVLHAIEYLLGRLPRSYLTQLRAFGGLQPYPSRTKDVFPVDFSTGSVGLGSAAPLFGALADRYVKSHFRRSINGQFISLLGDAELDEGNLWEAILEPETKGLSNVLWIVDLNRQSLDRVVPTMKAQELELEFQAAGWRVLELKYGRRLREAFAHPDGELLRRRIDEMPNQEYQALFAKGDESVVEALLDGVGTGERNRLRRLLGRCNGSVASLIHDLGGHDLADIRDALDQTRGDSTKPTALFAYTIKGYGLPIAGDARNHSALLSAEQISALRISLGLGPENDWDGFDPATPEGELCELARRRLERGEPPVPAHVPIPATIAASSADRLSTQSALGRILLQLSRTEAVADRLVTVSPDVSVSTNLGGWINKVGVWSLVDGHHPSAETAPPAQPGTDAGRHIELGISEMNFFLLLGQLGLAAETTGERLFPVGTLYDPFICRGLEGLIYSVYSGSRFIVAGTPSGISLSREGGAHQSTITPGIGMELPGLLYTEPSFVQELEWILLDGLRQMQEPEGEALYLRLSTKPIDQRPFAELLARRGEDTVRADVLAGGYRLREPGDFPDAVVIAVSGALVPEALTAAEQLEDDEEVAATVLVLSSPDKIYRNWRSDRLQPLRAGQTADRASHLDKLVTSAERDKPLVTVVDGASHSLAFLGGCLGSRTIPLGIDSFGQAGSQPALYQHYEVSPDAITIAALAALEPDR
jgi:pyruvate dehydrogenase E1 component